MSDQTCEMVVSWTARRLADGDVVPDQDIACGKPAAFVDKSGGYCCRECFDEMLNEDPELVVDYDRLAPSSGR